jgi:hypothetical protein
MKQPLCHSRLIQARTAPPAKYSPAIKAIAMLGHANRIIPASPLLVRDQQPE